MSKKDPGILDDATTAAAANGLAANSTDQQSDEEEEQLSFDFDDELTQDPQPKPEPEPEAEPAKTPDEEDETVQTGEEEAQDAEGEGEAEVEQEGTEEPQPEGESQEPDAKDATIASLEQTIANMQQQISAWQQQWQQSQQPPAPQQQPTPDAVTEVRAAAVKELAEKRYALSREDSEALGVDDSQALSRLAAEVHVGVVESIMQHVNRSLHGMVEGVLQQQQEQATYWGQFDAAWPWMKEKHGESYRNLVNQYGAVWRQMNPEGSMEDFIRQVGAQVALVLGGPPPKTTKTQAVKATPEPTSRRKKPSRPAAAASATGPSLDPAKPSNTFAAFAEDDMKGDF
jgi:hypothetical protein